MSNRTMRTSQRIAFAALLPLTTLSGAHSSAQILHAAGPRPSFEVATIKPASPEEARFSMGFTAGGRGFHATDTTVRDMVQEAWNVKSTDQIEGAPGWATGQKFDIEARMSDEEAASLAALSFDQKVRQVRLMMQSLLEERCGLKLHSSIRESTFFELMPAKGGPKLKPTQMSPADPADTSAHPAVGPRIQWKGPGRVEAVGTSMPMVAEFLSRQPELGFSGGFTLGDLVVDKTGLSGMYDWTLSWEPDADLNRDAAGGANGPSLFTALEEQLGLELKKTKGQVEVLVIDRVTQPSPD